MHLAYRIFKASELGCALVIILWSNIMVICTMGVKIMQLSLCAKPVKSNIKLKFFFQINAVSSLT